MRIAAILLARSSSKRLPNKHFLKIGDRFAIDYTIDKLLIHFSAKDIILATSDNESDDHYDEYGKARGIKTFRGSLENVAERFIRASKSYDYAFRINGDNVFLDSNLIETALQKIRIKKYSIVTNSYYCNFPSGMTVEAFKVTFFKSYLDEISKNKDWAEHVSKFFYDNYDLFKYDIYRLINLKNLNFNKMKLSLDDKLDYELLCKIEKEFTDDAVNYNIEEIFQIYENITR
jgi:spore coat polysaccharide biosynthesis protein SpsF